MENMIMQEKQIKDYKVGESVQMKILVLSEIAYKTESTWGSYIVKNAYSDETLFDNHFSISGVLGQQLISELTYDVEGVVTEFKGQKQIKVSKIMRVVPVSKQGFIGYLKSFKGLGNILASRIWDEFGERSTDLLKSNPNLVAKRVNGLSVKKATYVSEQFKIQGEKENTILNIMAYGVTYKSAIKIWEKYGKEILQMLADNPYMLVRIADFSFKKVDKVAIGLGVDVKDHNRLCEGIIYMLEEISEYGHCYIEKESFIPKATNFLSIKINEQDMKGLLIKNTEKYIIGEQYYPINIDELSDCYKRCIKEKSAKLKEYAQYRVVEILDSEIEHALDLLVQQNRVVIDEGKVYLKKIWNAENNIVNDIFRLSTDTKDLDKSLVKNELDKLLKEKNIILEQKQYQACLEFNYKKGGFYILTGNAGCGKTFTLSIIFELANRLSKIIYKKDLEYKFFAPTGKASKVMTKATGKHAETIHLGLGYSPTGFALCRDNQIESDFIVVDETSMLNIFLCQSLLEAIKSGTKVIFMGDIKQLPSIGAGNVLKDLINSNVINVIELDVVKRQNALSSVNLNANRIINKQAISSSEDKNFLFVSDNEEKVSFKKLLNAYIRCINKFDKNDVQILAPQRNGLLGVNYLNYAIQKQINGADTDKKLPKGSFNINIDGIKKEIPLFIKVGDKVINTKNQYNLQWYNKHKNGAFIENPSIVGVTNGETGIVCDICNVQKDGESIKRVIVKFDDGYVFFDESAINNLELAYAITVHKSQGSQWLCVLIPIVSSHSHMLENNLLYTAVTRATDYCFCYGQYQAMIRGINQNNSRKRKTSLKERLKERLELKVA